MAAKKTILGLKTTFIWCIYGIQKLKNSTNLSKTVLFPNNNSFQLTYLRLKRAKFGPINDLMHFWLNKVARIQPSFANLQLIKRAPAFLIFSSF